MLRAPGLREQHPDRRREQAGHGAAVGDGLVEVAAGAEARHQRHAGARHECAHRRVVLGVAVEQRQDDEVPVLGRQADRARHGLAGTEVVGVRHEHALRPRRRPGRIEDGRLVRGRRRRPRGRRLGTLCNLPAEVDRRRWGLTPADEHCVDPRAPAAHPRREVEPRRLREDQPALGVRHQVLELGCRRRRVDGDDDRAELRGAEPEREKLQAVSEEQRHRVAPADAEEAEEVGRPVHFPVELAVGARGHLPMQVVEDDERCAGARSRLRLKQRAECPRAGGGERFGHMDGAALSPHHA